MFRCILLSARPGLALSLAGLSLAGLALAALTAGGARADEAYITPSVVYSTGGKSDGSINEITARGLRRVAFVTQVAVAEHEPRSAQDFVPMLRDFATQDRSPIVAVGALQAAAVGQVAKAYPYLKFALIDGVVDLPNVRSIVFREQEAAFLAGIAAALASKSGRLGFIGGLDTPPVHRARCGFEHGVRFANPAIEVQAELGRGIPGGWDDPELGRRMAERLFERGVDVVLAVAGTTVSGVVDAARARGKLVVTGMDQARMAPGTVLTAMVRRYDVAAFETVSIAGIGQWKGGRTEMGLSDGAVDWMVGDFNENLITPQMRARVDEARQRIIDGSLVVPDYLQTGTCPK